MSGNLARGKPEIRRGPMVVAQITIPCGPRFFSPSKTPKGTSASRLERVVIAHVCGGNCCRAVVGPVVTVHQSAEGRNDGGGSGAGPDLDRGRVPPGAASTNTHIQASRATRSVIRRLYGRRS